MTGKNIIHHLPHQQIDIFKWDSCVQHTRSLIYNCSWVLDSIAENWDGLVLNDYEAIMPLIWRKKYGVHYLYQPYFAAQTGISCKQWSASLTDLFIQSIPSHFKYIDISLDERNDSELYKSSCRSRINMLADIDKPYADIAKQYHRLARRMIGKAAETGLQVDAEAGIADSISFFRHQYKAQFNIPDEAYDKLHALFQAAKQRNQASLLSAQSENNVQGIYLLLHDQQYVYSVIGGSSPEGKQKGAFYLLTDQAIKTSCETGKRFRFEGSDLAGIANFNRQFGAQPFYYDQLRINRLPPIVRWFKK